ncbi:MAG: amino acid adenylation domain-containing protein, partial [Pyrinomonadaceae bacterium]
DRPRPAVQSFRGGRRQFTLGEGVSGRVSEVARGEGVTQFMLLLAAFDVLLSRYSGQQDIMVGAPVAGRERVEIEGLIGFFVNTLVLRTDLSGNPSFRELLGRVRAGVTSAQVHQSLPFEKLVEELQPERTLSHSPLFQVMFVLQNAPQGALELPGLKLSVVGNEASVAKFDLTLEMIEGDDQRLYGGLDYNADLFDHDTAGRLLEHFRKLLEAALDDLSRPLSMLPMLTAPELEKLLGDWAGFETEYPENAPVSQLFEKQVEQTPDAVAVVFESEQLTYRQLNARANQLARHLMRLNVRPETRVALCLERSLEMVVGLLAVLKAGGAFVPLDPSYPRDRLSLMLNDTQAPVLLTQEKFKEVLPEYAGVTICLDAQRKLIAAETDENPASSIAGDNLAYVMYTSGSTGTPKASCIPHRAVARLVKATNYAEFGPEHTFLQFAPISFDASTLEIWGSLLNGGRLAVFPAHTPTLEELGQAIRQYQVTSLWLTSGLFNQMVEDQLEPLKGVRQLLAGGDVLSVPHVRRALREMEGCRLINGYGPTENTTFTCCHRIEDDARLDSSIPIGHPIANTRVFILDKMQQLVPAGVTGELCVGGDGLARGYLNDAGLTAEKFIPNPFMMWPGERLYRTGDLVRHLPGGAIEFVGRVDNQVKVRGFRVELGEIEATLSRHPSVQQSVVVTQGENGAKSVVAYVVAKQDELLGVAELRNYCSEMLPKYMAPSAFVMLGSLPLTPNGKVDRRALMALSRDEGGPESPVAEPRTPIEKALVEMWAEVLNLTTVGIHDNFFDLGGHSLATTQVASRVSNVFGVQLALRTLFEAPTIAGLALCVEEELSSGPNPYHVAPIQSAPKDEPLPLSFAQQRLWFLDQFEPHSSLYNIISVIRLTGQLDVSALERSLNEIVRRHEVLRTVFTVVAGETRQVILPAESLKLEVHDLSGLPAPERERAALALASEEGRLPFDLSRPPLLRVALVRLAETEHIAVLTMHHIVSDGWSMGVLVREVAALYTAYSRGEESPLSELEVQYADYAVWQRGQLQGEALERELAYWRKQLEGAPAVLELPTDRPRPAVQSFRGGRRQFTLSEGVSGRVSEVARGEGVTQFMLLLAAFDVMLSRYSGQQDILVGTGIANRNRVETESLIGFFLNSLVLRTDLSGDPSFRELLGRVREMTLGAYAHQNLPFEKLVEALRPERSLSRNPLFQVWFILQNAPMPSLNLPGLTLSPVEVEPESSRFDLGMGLLDVHGTLGGWIEYNKDLFDESTIVSMAGHFEAVLDRAITEPATRLGEFREMLDEKDRQEVAARQEEYRKTIQEKLQQIRRRPNTTTMSY